MNAMKHLSIYGLSIAAALFTLCACQKEKISSKEDLESRPQVSLDVWYAMGGEAVTSLSFPHQARNVSLEVNVNSENLRWNLESSGDWCRVVPEEHRGTGIVTLEI